jgi:hypothetical protein
MKSILIPKFAGLIATLLFVFVSVIATKAATITIIESYDNPGQDMDSLWSAIATGMGETPHIVSQSTLSDTAFFQTTDVLIVSSGTINLPANSINTIKEFIQHGGPTYLQCEFTTNFTTNQAFASIVNSLGGSFSWGGTQSGQLVPMQVLGSLANTPNVVDSLNYFWYGCAGLGDATIENFLKFQSQYFGFIFHAPNPAYGPLITASDQDWIIQMASFPLMQNILSNLIQRTGVSPPSAELASTPKLFLLRQPSPNPFNPLTSLTYELPHGTKVDLSVFDVFGNRVADLINSWKNAGTYQVTFEASHLASGMYLARFQAGDYQEVQKLVLQK